MRIKNTLLVGLIAALAMTTAASAVVDFYLNEADWLAAVEDVETLITTDTNVGLATELSSPPSQNTNCGPILTFETVNTGMSQGFQVQTIQSGAWFTFSDGEPAPVKPGFEDALSVGDINNHEDDNWQLLILPGGRSVFAFAFDLRHSQFSTGESMSVYDGLDALLGSTTAIPAGGLGSDFLGFVSSDPFVKIVFDEDPLDDDIAIADFRFAVPEPMTMSLLAAGGIPILKRRKRS